MIEYGVAEDFPFRFGGDGEIAGKIERLFRFRDGRSGGVDGGVHVDDGDTAVGGEAYLSCLIHCFDLYFRPIDLLFRFIGIITS